MGCDIHLTLERHSGIKWVAIDTFQRHHSQYAKSDAFMEGLSLPIARIQNYERFAALAGVRGEGPKPRGIPADASETTQMLIDDWGGDGHSHSWLSLKDATKIWLATHHGKMSDLIRKYPTSYYFNVDCSEDSLKAESNYRVVFWFDN